MVRRLGSLVALGTAISLLMAAGAQASCGDRPGTPTNLTATATNATSVNLQWRNTTRGGNYFWDIEVRDGRGNPVGLDRAGTGNLPAAYGTTSGLTPAFSTLQPNSTYCFRIRTRTRAGTKGCVSQLWSNQTCVTTPDPERTAFCRTYANDALNQVGTLQGYRKPGECAAVGGRWDVQSDNHYNWCMGVRGQPQSASWPDNERNIRNQIIAKCKPVTASGSVSVPAPKPPAPVTPPPAPVCAVNTLVTVEQCYNVDGTPSQYYPAGSTQTLGCGVNEDEAENAAKISFNGCLADDPSPGCCTFSKQTFNGVCACSPMRNARTFTRPQFKLPQQAQCAGQLKPNAAGRCACPEGTTQSGFSCLASAGGPSMIQPQTPGATPAADKACLGNMTMDGSGRCACPAGTVWNVRQCVPSSGGSGGINMVQPQSPGSGGTNMVRPGPGGITPGSRPPAPAVIACPAGTAGIFPNCRPFGGGINSSMQPGPRPQSQAPVQSQVPVQSQAPVQQACPDGTRPLTRRGRIIRCMVSQRPPGGVCPTGTFGRHPNCRPGTGGINTSRPADVTPQVCPPGTVGRFPRCRPVATPQVNVCPPGTVGRYPRCRPTGAGGTNPSRPIETRPRECPPGTFGRFPRCRSIATPTPKPTPVPAPAPKPAPAPRPIPTGPSPKPIPQKCPSGLTGPKCDQIIVR